MGLYHSQRVKIGSRVFATTTTTNATTTYPIFVLFLRALFPLIFYIIDFGASMFFLVASHSISILHLNLVLPA